MKHYTKFVARELKKIKHKSFFADCVRQNPVEAIPMIKDQIKDHRVKVCEIIGERLVTIVENL